MPQHNNPEENNRLQLRRPNPALWEKLKPLVREMRHNPTPAENKMWQRLRRKQVMGQKFRRQHAILRFIVDFYCPAACLVIEIDGHSHEDTSDYDARRTEILESMNLRVIRFTNQQVMTNLAGVIDQIEDVLGSQLNQE